MASTHKHIRSSTANKRPTTAIADGQIALNTNTTSPGLFFKDSTGATVIKIGPVHVGTTAPNVSPPAGGSSGNSTGEVWLDTSLTPNGVKIWNGSSWTNATPIGSTTVQGLLELATIAETQTGADTGRAVTPAGLQSKVSDSTSTTSSTTIASSTAVKAAYDLANAALPKSGGTITGNLEIGTTGSLTFEGATADAFETIIAVTDPTADRTITLPDTTGTVVTTGDTGTVTSTMIADGTIVDADVNASAAIAGTKISPDFGSQNVVTTGTSTAASFIPTSSTVPTNGVYLPAANSVALATNSGERCRLDSAGRLLVRTSTSISQFGVQPQIQSTGTSGANGYLGLTVFNTVADSAPNLVLGHSKGGSIGTYTASVANDLMGEVSFTAGNGTDMRRGASIGGYADATWGTNDHPGRLVFSTTASGSATPSERLRITSAGNVGIGTTSPSAQLHVQNSSGNSESILGQFGTGTQIKLGAYANEAIIYAANNASAALSFYTNSSERLRITSAGNVGIGTSSPGGRLDVQGGDIFLGKTTQGDILFSDGNDTYAKAANNIFLQTPNGTTRVTIKGNTGNVGIGTTSPGQRLTVGDGSATGVNYLRVHSANSDLLIGQSGGSAFGMGTSLGSVVGSDASSRPLAVGTFQNQPLLFGTNNTERARIDSSGRLLVGTSSAREPLSALSCPVQIEGTDIGTAALSITRSQNNTDGPGIWLAKNRGGLGANATVVNGDELGSVIFTGNNGTNQIQAASIKAFADGTVSGGGAADMPGRLVFSTTADGASSPTERMRIGQAGVVWINPDQTGCVIGSGAAAGTASALIIGRYSRTTHDTGTTSFNVFTNGNVTNTNNSYGAISDIKLKENIIDATSQWSDIKALQVRKYNFKEGQTHTQIGLVAQEVELVSPGLVTESPDRDAVGNDLGTVTKSVNYSVLYMKAVKALQEAMERIETLEAKVAALEST